MLKNLFLFITTILSVFYVKTQSTTTSNFEKVINEITRKQIIFVIEEEIENIKKTDLYHNIADLNQIEKTIEKIKNEFNIDEFLKLILKFVEIVKVNAVPNEKFTNLLNNYKKLFDVSKYIDLPYNTKTIITEINDKIEEYRVIPERQCDDTCDGCCIDNQCRSQIDCLSGTPALIALVFVSFIAIIAFTVGAVVYFIKRKRVLRQAGSASINDTSGDSTLGSSNYYQQIDMSIVKN